MFSRFLDWIHLKYTLHTRHGIPSFRERDVFWCSLGENIGDEECGKGESSTRPILIIRKFNKNIFIGVPLSSKLKDTNPFYVKISIHQESVSAMTSQLRLLDAHRLHKKICTLDQKDFQAVQRNIRDVVFKNFAGVDEDPGIATSVDL